MLSHRFFLTNIVCFLLFAVGSLESVHAQSPRDKTILTIDILVPRESTDYVKAQEWGRIFSQLGYNARIATPAGSGKPEIKESMRGSLRVVRLTGAMDRNGELYFPETSFRLTEVEALEKWLNELIVFGSQGSPEGKKLWGLNQAQFGEVVKDLSRPLTISTQGKPVREILAQFPFSQNFPFTVDPSARAAFDAAQDEPVLQELKGISLGTALAALLNDLKLGFLPLRTPAGSLELNVRPISDLTSPWPVGWKLDESTPRSEITPSLFKMVMTGFENQPLSVVLSGISEQTAIPIVVNHAALEAANIDLTETTVSYPRKKIALSLVLTSSVRQSKLSHEIRQDESGRPLIWVTPFVPYTLGEEPSHSLSPGNQ